MCFGVITILPIGEKATEALEAALDLVLSEVKQHFH